MVAGCCDRQPDRAPWPPWQDFRQTKLEASGCEWIKPHDSESKLADKDEKEKKKKEEKKEKRKKKEKKGYYVS